MITNYLNISCILLDMQEYCVTNSTRMIHNFLRDTKNSDNSSWSNKIFLCMTIIRFLLFKIILLIIVLLLRLLYNKNL